MTSNDDDYPTVKQTVKHKQELLVLMAKKCMEIADLLAADESGRELTPHEKRFVRIAQLPMIQAAFKAAIAKFIVDGEADKELQDLAREMKS